MALLARVARQVTRWAHEDATHVHEFAEGEVNQQDAQECKVNKEDRANAIRYYWAQRCKTHGESLNSIDVHLVDVAHANAAAYEADQEEQWEIVVHQGDETKLCAEKTATKQEEQSSKHDRIRKEHTWCADLQHAVNHFKEADARWHWLQEETEVTDKNHQETVVEHERKEPQPFRGIINGTTFFSEAQFGISEERTEGQHFKNHTAYCGDRCKRTVKTVRLNP